MSKILRVNDIPDDDILYFKMTMDPVSYNFFFDHSSRWRTNYYVPFMPDNKDLVDKFMLIDGVYYCLVHSEEDVTTIFSNKCLIVIFKNIDNNIASDIINGINTYYWRLDSPKELRGTFNYV